MAGLVGRHELDCTRVCACCGRVTSARYNGAQILVDDAGRIAEARLYTCGECGSTYSADHDARSGLTDDDLMRVTDRREWADLRAARTRGEAA